MGRKHNASNAQIIATRVLKFAAFVIMSFLAVRLGMAGGNALSTVDASIIRNVDAEHFKTILNNSMPLINTTYNSGNISVSISGEIRSIVRSIFGFDLSMPVSILTAQSSPFLSYYHGGYQQLLAMRNVQEFSADDDPGLKAGDPDLKPGDADGDDLTGNEGSESSPGTSEGSNNIDSEAGSPEGKDSNFIEAASSISTDVEESENKRLTDDEKVSIGKIEVLNETKNKIDSKMIETLLKEPLKFTFDKKGPKVLIFHTHATEGFIRNLDELNDKKVLNWTRDSRYNVVRVGAELAQYLEKKYDIDVIHNGAEHDYPDFNSAYRNAFKTLNSVLPGNPSIKVALDIHRDGAANGKLRVTREIDGKTCAQVMLVVAAANPKWKENFKLAVKIQEKLNKYAPGLARPIYISKYTYNQNMTPGSLTIEIGGDGNMLGECLESTKYIAMALSEVLNNET